VLVSNVAHGKGGDLRTVGFAQRHGGMAVMGGAVSFLFKRDRMIVIGSTALPHVTAVAPRVMAPDDALAGAAAGWIERGYGARPKVIATGEVMVLPVVRERDDGRPPIEYRTVRPVVVDLAAPRARWDVYVDAETAAPVAREQTLRFGTGTLVYDAPIRHPGARMEYPAANAAILVDGAPFTTSAGGGFTFNGTGTANVTTSVAGPQVAVTPFSDVPASAVIPVPDGTTAPWSAAPNELVDAQVSAFVHAGLIKEFARTTLAPELSWLDQQLAVSVNEPGTCQAYSLGSTIHFHQSDGVCENYARLADVVYHEFGHALHLQSIIPGVGRYDAHFTEGAGDYLAAAYTGDPVIGRGYTRGDPAGLRDLDPADDEAVFPEDMHTDPHISGLIFAGAMWDLRTELAAELGAAAAATLANDLYMATLRRATDIPSSYVEVLAGDDDDGDLLNGTPRKCAIDRAFGRHGLVDLAFSLGVSPPRRDGMNVLLPVATPPAGCPQVQIDSVVVDWRLAGATETQRVTLASAAGGFAGAIPPQAEGAVVQFQVTLTLGSGGEYRFPQNAVDPWYAFYVGPLIDVYCTDFESDPFAAGWTHTAVSGTSDWEWGQPQRTDDVDDPPAAFSGANAVGTDLGGGSDGLYEFDVETRLTSPVIDVTGREVVRLQYRRWLSVEDGFWDDATIVADGAQVWGNFTGPDQDDSNNHHIDQEWFPHDVDLTAQAADGSVQVAFRLESDGGEEWGGWQIDDFCIRAKPFVGETCGDGELGGNETCDDGNTADGDGCSATCGTEFRPPEEGCCSGSGGPAGPVALGLLSGFALLRRRRRATCKGAGGGAFGS
jgi:cysteine-rich repeat protein